MDLNKIVTIECACPKCGKVHTVDLPESMVGDTDPTTGKPKLWCDSCMDSRRKDAAKLKPDEEWWAGFVPKKYRTLEEGGDTDLDRLKTIQVLRSSGLGKKGTPVTFGEIVERGGAGRSIWMMGETGLMKTRVAFRVLRALHERRKQMVWYTAWRFQAEFQDHAGRHQSVKWMDSLAVASVVFIDDIGKAPWTPNTSAAFFEMLEERTSHGLQCIFTSQHKAADLGEMYAKSSSLEIQGSAEALALRLSEFVPSLLFVKPEAK